MELRRFNRVPLDTPVLFARKEDDAFVDGVARDISLGGMFVTSESPADFGAEITIHLTLDGDQAAVLPATVRWVRADGMGVQFGNLGARDTFTITEIVRRHEQSTG